MASQKNLRRHGDNNGRSTSFDEPAIEDGDGVTVVADLRDRIREMRDTRE